MIFALYCTILVASMFYVALYCHCQEIRTRMSIRPAVADQMCAPEHVSFEAVTRSAVPCVQICATKPGCRSVIYLRGNHTCLGINTYDPFWFWEGTATSSLLGAVFYNPTIAACGEGRPMVAGLPDSQMTATSEYSSGYSAAAARLDNSFFCWTVADEFVNDAGNHYIQVDFAVLKQITTVITQGDPIIAEWITGYTLATSSDCATFAWLREPNGNIQVFGGNSDKSTKVSTCLPQPHVVCRCLRLRPNTWHVRAALRLDVLGVDM